MEVPENIGLLAEAVQISAILLIVFSQLLKASLKKSKLPRNHVQEGEIQELGDIWRDKRWQHSTVSSTLRGGNSPSKIGKNMDFCFRS